MRQTNTKNKGWAAKANHDSRVNAVVVVILLCVNIVGLRQLCASEMNMFSVAET